MQIAIVGAGFAGLVLAEKLVASGLAIENIDIFEKSRGPGGRLATRYHDKFVFDHGAPFFTARTEVFRQWLAPKIHSGLVAEWAPKTVSLEKHKKLYKRQWFEPHYLANEKMSCLGKALAGNFERRIFRQHRVVSLARDENMSWFLNVVDARGHSNGAVGDQTDLDVSEKKGPYGAVLVAIPGPQAEDLIGAASHEASIVKKSVRPTDLCMFRDPGFFQRHQISVDKMAPEYTLMLGFKGFNLEKNGIHWQLAKVSNSSLAWISVEHNKPGRYDSESKEHFESSKDETASLIVRSTERWAKQHLNAAKSDVENAMISELSDILGFNLPEPQFSRLHRWMYAQSSREHLEIKKNTRTGSSRQYFGSDLKKQLNEKDQYSVYDSELGLGVCGDWLISGNVESAFLSADSLAARVATHIVRSIN